MKRKTFYNFMMEQLGCDDAGGDLAEDIKGDKSAKKVKNDYEHWEAHLVFNGARGEVLETFEEAWREYELAYPKTTKNDR